MRIFSVSMTKNSGIVGDEKKTKRPGFFPTPFTVGTFEGMPCYMPNIDPMELFKFSGLSDLVAYAAFITMHTLQRYSISIRTNRELIVPYRLV